jgi:peptidoglycan/LPS O-acetylase OafA/YrhL
MSERSTIAYQPALDGVRALAVAAVLLFHAEVAGFDGGYLGVSVFFTLSGYLITSLLVHEYDRTDRVDLRTFYGRRVRRLLPASALCLAAIVLISVVSDAFVGVADLRRQIVGSILQVANWVFLAGEGSYQQIFQSTGGARSPVEHFWSCRPRCCSSSAGCVRSAPARACSPRSPRCSWWPPR